MYGSYTLDKMKLINELASDFVEDILKASYELSNDKVEHFSISMAVAISIYFCLLNMGSFSNTDIEKNFQFRKRMIDKLTEVLHEQLTKQFKKLKDEI